MTKLNKITPGQFERFLENLEVGHIVLRHHREVCERVRRSTLVWARADVFRAIEASRRFSELSAARVELRRQLAAAR